MTTSLFSLLMRALLAIGMVAAWTGVAQADDSRAGTVEWSDGRKLAAAISLTPGKDLRVVTSAAQVAIKLDEVKEIRFTPEKEEMWEGFYFPNAGQATQVKTGEVYPIRYLHTQLTLTDGQVVEGHLFTTTFYLETDDATEKLVVLAKQSGANGQKLADLVYPTLISFESGGASTGSAQIDLTAAGFVPLHPPVIVAEPDLALLPMNQTAGKPIWRVPVDNPAQILFAVQAADGIHVAWPAGASPGGMQVVVPYHAPDRALPSTPPVSLAEVDPMIRAAVETGLRDLRDFYDTRTLLGSFAGGDGTDVYSLVMMKRLGKTYTFRADKIPWSLVLLRWKYDADAKKVTLLNRVMMATGRASGDSPLPSVLREPELLRDVSGGK